MLLHFLSSNMRLLFVSFWYHVHFIFGHFSSLLCFPRTPHFTMHFFVWATAALTFITYWMKMMIMLTVLCGLWILRRICIRYSQALSSLFISFFFLPRYFLMLPSLHNNIISKNIHSFFISFCTFSVSFYIAKSDFRNTYSL